MAITTGYYDFTDGVTYAVPVDALNRVFVLRNRVNCTAAAKLVDISTQTDVKIFNIREGWFVWNVWYTLQDLSTLGSVIDSVGDAAAVNTWITTDSSSLVGTLGQSAGGVHATDTACVLNGKLYTANDYIYAIFKTLDFDGILDFSALVVDVFGGLTIV